MPEQLSVDHLTTASDKPPNAEVMNVPKCGRYACARQLKNTNMRTCLWGDPTSFCST